MVIIEISHTKNVSIATTAENHSTSCQKLNFKLLNVEIIG